MIYLYLKFINFFAVKSRNDEDAERAVDKEG